MASNDQRSDGGSGQGPGNGPDDLSPPPARDPRLEIPEILQKPVELKHTVNPQLPKPVTGMGDLGKALAIGLDFLFTIAAAGLLGYLLDRWQGWSPYGLLIGLGIGFFAAVVRILQRLNRDERAGSGQQR